jgi:uncharacterized protein YecE (DUF72 family)
MSKLFVGTSGFSYPHWRGHFYPQDLAKSEWLLYYKKYFDTVEINATFYRQIKKETLANWRKMVGENFVFALKGNRFISHIKRLKNCQEEVGKFFEVAGGLLKTRAPLFSETRAGGGGKSKQSTPSLSDLPIRSLGDKADTNLTADHYFERSEKQGSPTKVGGSYSSKRVPSSFSLNIILWQLPPGMKADTQRLDNFLKILPADWRYAFEFRNTSWLKEKIFKILEKYKAAVVFQDYPQWPITERITADFVYLRFHGRQALYSSCYTKKELTDWAKRIQDWLAQGLDVYAYFNNDALGYAVENAKRLVKLLQLV